MPRITANRAQFRLSLAKWKERVNGNMTLFVNEFCTKLMMSIIDATPNEGAGTVLLKIKRKTTDAPGLLRASWQVSPDPGSIKVGQKFIMVNTAPYAMRIEFGFSRRPDSLGRKYHQKGRGFVRKTMTQVSTIANEVIAGLPK